jgi:glycosyltransferase involved in cell wall biosynthesis
MERAAFSVVVPTFNEESSIRATLHDLSTCINELRDRFDVELLIVDDGSHDDTVALVRRFSQERPNELTLVVHEHNAGLVAAMRTGAERARYGTVVFLDADLSYRPTIVEPLVRAKLDSGASVALASPYMKGGRVANVPLSRLVASRGANWLLARCVSGRLHTFTGMVRAYDRERFLDLFATEPTGEFNAWAVAMFLAEGRTVVEIPADLVWPTSRTAAPGRISTGKLWERVWLVITTATVMTSAMRLGARRARLGPLVLSSQTNGPWPSES